MTQRPVQAALVGVKQRKQVGCRAMYTCIGGASGGEAKKAGSVHSLGNRQTYQTQEEKRNFIRESFQLDSNKILNNDTKLKEK